MTQGQLTTETAALSIENIGGISESAIELGPGVTILSGRNATNRTSLLQALMAALGSDNTTLKGDAEEGFVELTLGDTTYTRRLERRDGTVVTDGDPYLEDATLADLFAFLLESNEARRAVARGDDLREIIMRPVDTDDIQARISRLESRREELDAQLDEIRQLKQRLPDLEERRADLESELDAKRETLQAKETEIEDIDTSIEDRREEQAELDAKFDELSDLRSQLDTIRHDLDSEQESIDALRDERDELQADLEAYSDPPEDRIEELDAEIQRLRNQKQRVESTVNELQTVIQFNEELLDGSLDMFEDLHDADDDGAVTDRLLADGEDVVCWTCGSQVPTTQIEETVDLLRDLRNRKMEQRNDLDDHVDTLQDEKIELEERQRQHDRITTRLERIEQELQERQDRIDDLQARRDDLTDRIEALEAEVETVRQEDDDAHEELLELHKEANQLEVEINRLETDLEEVEAEIQRIDERAAERDELEAQREETQAEIEDLRTKVERLEEQAVEEFNDHMDAILEILEYNNLERIWIERTEQELREGRRHVTRGQFDLHVVRSTESGAVYEDTVEHLSESEREVTGLVFALAGYLAHDLHEDLPFILLDSVEALDSERISALVEYFREYATYLVVALLPEDAGALDEEYRRVTDI